MPTKNEPNNDQLKNYTFTVTLGGLGKTPEEAWNDACESFCLDFGECPTDYEIEEIID